MATSTTASRWRSRLPSTGSATFIEKHTQSTVNDRDDTPFGTTTLASSGLGGALLPAPVTSRASSLASATHVQRDSFDGGLMVNPTRGPKRSPHFAGGLRERWASFVKRMGSGTAPSTSSILDVSRNSIQTCIGDDRSSFIFRPQTSNGDSSLQLHRINKRPEDEREEPQEVDEIVVDRKWSEDIKTSTVPSDHGGGVSPEKSAGQSNQPGSTDRESTSGQAQGLWAHSMILIVLRYRIWPAVTEFFFPRFLDEKSEAHYRKELWFYRKVREVPNHVLGLTNQRWFIPISSTPLL
jgi:hypothetical protein